MIRGGARTRLEAALLALLLPLFAMGAVQALGFPGGARWLPLGSAGAGVLLALWCGVRLLKPSGEDHEPAPGDRVDAGRGFRHLLITLALALPVAALGGFLLAVPVCYLSFGLLSRGRTQLVPALVVSAVSAAVTWFLFGYLLGVPLTRGVVW